MVMEKLRKSHTVVVCEGSLDGCFIKEIAQRLGLKVRTVRERNLSDLASRLRELRPSEHSGRHKVIIFPVGGSVESLLDRVLNYVININYNARAYLAKVLALVDQDDEPTPADKAHKVIQKTLNALRSALLKYKPGLKLENNVHSGSSNYVDKLIGKGESKYAKTLLRVVVVNNCLECELVRILTRNIIRDREQCHDVLR